MTPIELDVPRPQISRREQEDPLWEIQLLSSITSLSKVKSVFSLLHKKLPLFSDEQMRDFVILFPKLSSFSELKEEQAQIATDLGSWHIRSSLSDAMYYYAIALNIEETEERHILASKTFIQWILQTETYKKQLEHAYNMGDPQRFNQMIDLLGNLQSFGCKRKEFDMLWKLAQEVLKPKENRLEIFSDCVHKLDDLNANFCKGKEDFLPDNLLNLYQQAKEKASAIKISFNAYKSGEFNTSSCNNNDEEDSFTGNCRKKWKQTKESFLAMTKSSFRRFATATYR